MQIEFTVPGKPIGKGRPRVTMHGTYTPPRTVEYEKKVRECWQAQSGEKAPDGVPVFAFLRCYFPIPKSTSKKQSKLLEGTYHLKKPDTDNIIKSIMDALNGCAFTDDSCVQIMQAVKYQTNAAPRVEVQLVWDSDSDSCKE